MQVRPSLPAERRSQAQRRPHILERAGAVPGATPLVAERRHRAGGAPEDQAHYRCACGTTFGAKVSTTVVCPSCGSGQDW